MTARIVVVTGTDTGVGKTVTVAALAARALAERRSVVVVKPVQTGIGGTAPEPSDASVIERLTGIDVHEFVALDDPLAPDTAAQRQGVVLPTVREHVIRIRDLTAEFDLVIVEGAGGLLVRLDHEGGTLLDIARDLTFSMRRSAHEDVVETVVVCRAGLGTLNHTELTTTALRAVQIEPTGLVIGSWPDHPGLAEECNRADLTRLTGVPVVGVLPEGVGALDRNAFLAGAPDWFAQS